MFMAVPRFEGDAVMKPSLSSYSKSISESKSIAAADILLATGTISGPYSIETTRKCGATSSGFLVVPLIHIIVF